MTEAAATSEFDTGRERIMREHLADDAFAALKRGDEPKLAELLKATGDVRGQEDSAVTLLLGVVERKNEKLDLDQLVKLADPDGVMDPKLVALVLCATNGNVALADDILDSLDDDDDDDDDPAPVTSGTLLSVARAIKAERSSLRRIFKRHADDGTNQDDGTSIMHGIGSFFGKLCHGGWFSHFAGSSSDADTATTTPEPSATLGANPDQPVLPDSALVSMTHKIFGGLLGGGGGGGPKGPQPPAPTPPSQKS